VGGSVRRWRAALAATILAIVTALVAGSCWNPLNWALQTWGDLDMVKVKGGIRKLGSDDVSFPEENPSHWVTVSTFLMSRYEVTQQLYYAVMGMNPSYFQPSAFTDEPRRPVESVTWLDAVKFCNELSQYARFTPCYTINEAGGVVTCNFTADGYRLPTEAEWEFAARGGTANDGYYYKYAGSDNIGDVAWWKGNSDLETHPVGYWGSNELDLYDMTGNVWEWCWDTYDDTYYQWNTDWTDPLGPEDIYAYDAAIYTGCYMIVRGGSFGDDTTPADVLRTSTRAYVFDNWVDAHRTSVGFRVVRRP
jgi:formylglycine-generating enzyme required for sulfatase activity